MILKPGVFRDFPAKTYHAQPTPAPALSAGFIKSMTQSSPAEAWYNSPLNPKYQPKHSDVFDLGSAGHLVLLEPEKLAVTVTIIEAENWTTKAARQARDDAREAGRIPLLTKDWDRLIAMRDALHNRLPDLPFCTAPSFAADGLRGGEAELSLFWVDAATGIWCKARPDYVRPGARGADIIVDYKTMGDVANLEKYSYDLHWHTRSAWYLEGWRQLTGNDAEYWYLVQAKSPPYICSVIRMDERAMEVGWGINQGAKARFAEFLEYGHWLTGREQAITLSLPVWAEHQFSDYNNLGAINPADQRHKDKELMARVQALYAPELKKI